MTAPDLPEYLVVGHISKSHGTKGELVVQSLTDHPGDVFAPGVVLRLADADGGRPDPDLPPLRVAAVRPFQSGWLVSFGGVDDRNAADILRGHYVLFERARLPDLAAGEVFLHQLLGLQVVTVVGTRVGDVIEVYELRPANLLEVRTGQGTVLIPFLDWIVREVDVLGGRIVIDPPEGLLE